MSEKSITQTKSFQFAILVVQAYKMLTQEKKEFTMSKQFLRSGTAVGASVREAQNAESRADFVHKLAIAQKECDETIYWLDLLKETGYLDQKNFEELVSEATQLLKMIRSSILTTKANGLKKQ